MKKWTQRERPEIVSRVNMSHRLSKYFLSLSLSPLRHTHSVYVKQCDQIGRFMEVA